LVRLYVVSNSSLVGFATSSSYESCVEVVVIVHVFGAVAVA
jgi:hypothetical protein